LKTKIVSLKEEWTTKYFMQHFNGAAVCLICQEYVTVPNFNCKRHYETKHASTFNNVKGAARKLSSIANEQAGG